MGWSCNILYVIIHVKTHIKEKLVLFAGSFQNLNAEAIDEEIGGMWRTMYKLTKTFAEHAGPRRIADSVKSKIDKLKQHTPLLNVICNPGIRTRHWEQVRKLQRLAGCQCKCEI